MKPAIPSSHVVDSALGTVSKRLEKVRTRINASAAKEMKADHYEEAKKWMEMGSSVADFAQRLDAFAEEWKRLVKAARIVARADSGENQIAKTAAPSSAKRTPIWRLCEQALRALSARGGAASLAEVVEDLGRDSFVAPDGSR